MRVGYRRPVLGLFGGDGKQIELETLTEPTLDASSSDPRVFYIHNFLSSAEADEFIRFSTAPENPYKMAPSTGGTHKAWNQGGADARLSTRTSENAFDVTTENWLVKGFFAGIHFTTSFKTERRLFFNFDIIGGLPKCYLPKLTIKGFNQNGSVSESFGSSEKSAPAFMPTMGFRYYASNKFIINFDLSYLYTKVTFSDVSYSNTLGTRGLSKVTQKISTLNALFGISFVLD